MGWIEIVAALFGVLCVVLTIRQSILCWPAGLVQVLLYIYVFYEVRLYSDLILHVIYVVLSIYGWYHWLHGGDDRARLPVGSLPKVRLGFWVVVVLTTTVALGTAMDRLTDAALPYPDAFTTAASLVAQWLMARKMLESWGFWIAVDIAAIGVYLAKDLHPTALLYSIFLVLAVTGLTRWRSDLVRQAAPQPSPGAGNE